MIFFTFKAATPFDTAIPLALAPAPHTALVTRSFPLLIFFFIESVTTFPSAPTAIVPAKLNPGIAAIPPPTADAR